MKSVSDENLFAPSFYAPLLENHSPLIQLTSPNKLPIASFVLESLHVQKSSRRKAPIVLLANQFDFFTLAKSCPSLHVKWEQRELVKKTA
ncbi:hypothetical protein LguiA_007525 [Lonicera macranthoides]